ncbi:Periostin [Toxocara canis]|uniref:Periostin n=1 Tax=Toxocara canis TaxID=6265 RepID=A0A0B2VCQ1_TOXCA|nr:Periostin [Toxocara canis]
MIMFGIDITVMQANDFLEEMLSLVSGRKREKNSKKPIRRRITQSAHGALTLGEHVCVRENKVDVPNAKSVSVCTEFGKATRCINGGGNFTLVRMVECCKGYITSDIRKGCHSAEEMLSLSELLTSISDNCMNISAHKLHLSEATVLLTPSDICALKEGDPEEQIDNNIIDGIYHSYDFLDSQRIRTRSGRYVIAADTNENSKLPSLNCVEMDEGDITATDGIMHKLRHPLRTSSKNLFETISERSEFSTFVQLLDDDLKELLSSDKVSTVFAFTDEAFSALSHSLQMRMRQRSHCTKDLIKEHVHRGMHCSRRMQGPIKAVSGNGHEISKEVVDGTLFIRVGNARVLETDMIASNGIIHTVDDIILSEKFADWRDHLAVYEEGFLKLAEEVIPNEEEPAAIFVPPRESLRVDFKFVLLFQRWIQNLSDEKSFIQNHVVRRSEMITNNSITTEFGSKPLPIVRQNIRELLNTRQDLSVFRSLFDNSSLTELVDMESDAPYTLLLPSDDALSKNQIKALNENKTMAEKFVGRHIFKGFICSTQLYAHSDRFDNPKLLENLQREYFAGRSKSGQIIVGDSRVQEKDIIATNGIIHILESPLKAAAPPGRIPLYSSLLDLFDL